MSDMISGKQYFESGLIGEESVPSAPTFYVVTGSSVRRVIDDNKKQVFDAVEEAGGLARRRTFFQLWSLKEAALKSIGEGLPFGLDAFEFELAPNLRVVHAPRDHGGPERFNAHVIEATNSCAALVTRSMV